MSRYEGAACSSGGMGWLSDAVASVADLGVHGMGRGGLTTWYHRSAAICGELVRDRKQ